MIENTVKKVIKKLPLNTKGIYVRTISNSGCHIYFPLKYSIETEEQLELATKFRDSYQNLIQGLEDVG